jgi:hypothetical protein
MQNGYVESFNGRMRDELLNETLFLSLDHARVQIAAWVEDYNHERPHSALGYETPAAFATELHKQWPAPLRPTGSAAQAIASLRSCATKRPGSNPSWWKAGGHVNGDRPWVSLMPPDLSVCEARENRCRDAEAICEAVTRPDDAVPVNAAQTGWAMKATDQTHPDKWPLPRGVHI